MNYRNSTLVLEMDWIEILREHPENPYNTAHSTGGGLIQFNNAVIIDCEIAEVNFTADIESKKYFRYDDIEIYSYYEEKLPDTDYRYAEIDGFICNNNNFINISFVFRESFVKWNNFDSESWFAGHERNTDDIENILQMLSCSNSEEEQKKGTELAEDIYPSYLFQPFMDGKSEDLWNNCAIVLAGKTDKDLTPWLFQCFVWLSDMNRQGADVIFKRLNQYNDKEKLSHEKNKAVKTSEILNNDKWLETLCMINPLS